MNAARGWKEETAQRTPGMGGQLRPHKIERLDAVGALVDQRDGAVADELLHAVIADIPVAAIDLHAQVRRLQSEITLELRR